MSLSDEETKALAVELLKDESFRNRLLSMVSKSAKDGSVKGALDSFVSEYRARRIGEITEELDAWLNVHLRPRIQSEKDKIGKLVANYLEANLESKAASILERVVTKAFESSAAKLKGAVSSYIESKLSGVKLEVDMDEALKDYDDYKHWDE